MRKNLSSVVLVLCLAACGASDPAKPDPAPTPTPENLDKDTYCVPAPPPFVGFKVKIQNDLGWKKVLDARALVGPDAAYCASIGQTGNACVVRNEGDPQEG